MTGKTGKAALSFLVLILLGMAACNRVGTEVSQAPVQDPPPAVPITIEPDAPTRESLAHLNEFLPRVTFRRQKEMVWEEAIRNLPLFRFDAVRTHHKAGAKITFVNGSVVDMSPESLLIINPSSGENLANFDRLLMRKGNLKARTQKELWILTTAALFRIKPQRNESARGTVAVEEGKRIRVEVNEGEGLMLRTQRPGKIDAGKPIHLSQNKPIVIAAPTVPTDFGLKENEIEWPDPAAVEARAREVASVSPNQAKIPISDFIITSPPDYAEVSAASVEIKGLISGKDTAISVNGKTVSVNNKQEFRVKVPLTRGANAILIQLNRTEGSPVFRRWTVIRRE